MPFYKWLFDVKVVRIFGIHLLYDIQNLIDIKIHSFSELLNYELDSLDDDFEN